MIKFKQCNYSVKEKLSKLADSAKNSVKKVHDKVNYDPGDLVNEGVSQVIKNPIAATLYAAPVPGTSTLGAVVHAATPYVIPKKIRNKMEKTAESYKNSKVGKKVRYHVNNVAMNAPYIAQYTYSDYSTKYDSTDMLKKMKDSDILAEKYRKPKGIGLKSYLRNTGSGALIGVASRGVNDILKKTGKLKNVTDFADSILGNDYKDSAKRGALVGLVASGIEDLHKKGQESEEVEFFNDRLRQAKRQSKRREKYDWRNNITNREGYTY